ncbi:MAG: DUF1993 domain-containing protein [Pseudomonadota bacterium]
MTLTNLLVPTYRQMLTTLLGWLIKAQTQMPEEAEGLLLARIAPDMFPMSTQIRFACLQVREAVFRLRGDAFPESFAELVNEGRNAEDRPGTLADARKRVEETLAMLDNLMTDELDGDESRLIAHEIPNGMIFDLTATQYARDWALPQFYFHLISAYAILRSEGVALGKADYIPHMFAHIRPETMPAG